MKRIGGLSAGKRQFLKRQFNRVARERRSAGNGSPVDKPPRGKSLLEQDEIHVTPIVRFRHTCTCGATFVADSQEATCRRAAFGGTHYLTITTTTEPGDIYR